MISCIGRREGLSAPREPELRGGEGNHPADDYPHLPSPGFSPRRSASMTSIPPRRYARRQRLLVADLVNNHRDDEDQDASGVERPEDVAPEMGFGDGAAG